MRFFFKFLLLISFSFSSVVTFAQKVRVEDLSDDQVKEFFQKASASGLSENQIEALAAQRGYTPSDIIKMRERLTKIQGQTQKVSNQVPTTTERTQLGEIEERKPDEVRQSVEKKSSVFGADLFNSTNLTFEPNLRIPTPKDYVLGADDELRVDITGYVYQQYVKKISPEGTIQIENLAPIYLNGYTIEQAKDRIVSRLRSLYTGLNQSGSGLSAEVTLGSVRTIKVTIVGEATRPGTYSISSLASAFNALYVAGGPSASTGSFRDIKVIRNNKIIRKIDLYDFLLRGDQKDNVRLHDQDVIFISPFEAKVEIEGEVKRPAVYEIEKGTLLRDVVNYAGGFSEKAYTATINVRRNTAKELRILTLTNADINTFVLQRGDRISIGTILERYENKVEIMGAVFRPSEYAISDDTKTVKQLVQKAEGLREDAFLNRAYIRRERENLDPELIPFELGKLVRGEIADIPLKRQDIVTIKSVVELREERTITIDGAVNVPGTFKFIENMGVADLIAIAGGFSDAATSNKIEIARRIRNENNDLNILKTVEIIDLGLSKDLKMNDNNVILQPFDQVFVRVQPQYEIQKKVTIVGEVPYSGVYTIQDRKEKISDLIKRSGGIKSGAYLKGAKFVRGREQMAVDLEKIIDNPEAIDNLLLVDGDRLEIPRLKQTVEVAGQVQNPISFTYKEGMKLRQYINQAGGLTDSASVRKIYVRYSNGLGDRNRSIWFVNRFPKVEPGTIIYVPALPKKNAANSAERIAISTAIGSLALIVINILNSLK